MKIYAILSKHKPEKKKNIYFFCWILDIINMTETIIIEQGNTAIYRVGENEKVASDEDCWCAF